VVEDIFDICSKSRQVVNALVESCSVHFRFIFWRPNIVPLSLGDGTVSRRLVFILPTPRPADWATDCVTSPTPQPRS
jgi:hypothetical protein